MAIEPAPGVDEREGQPAERTDGHPRRWLILVVLCLALMMVVLAHNIVNLALPSLAEEHGASASELQWIVDAYTLAFAGLLLTSGSLGDRFGRRALFFNGLLLFGVSSLAAGYADGIESLLVARAVMGAGAAFVTPATLSLLISVFPANERSRAISLWAGAAGTAAGLGPALGGWLLGSFWAGAVFVVNVPIVALVVGLGIWLIPTDRQAASTRIDLVGGLLSVAAMTLLLFAIIEAPEAGIDSAQVVGASVAGFTVAGLFVAWERRTPVPIMDAGLWRDPRFSIAILALAVDFFAIFGSLFILSQYLQDVRSLSPLEAGAALTPLGLGLAVGAPLSAPIVARAGRSAALVWGLASIAFGLGALSLTGVSTPLAVFLVDVAFLGIGMGLVGPTATAAIMAAAPRSKWGVASATNDLARALGGALGVAVLGTVLGAVYRARLPDSVAGALGADGRGSLNRALAAAERLGDERRAALTASARDAFVDGMRISFIVATVAAATCAVVVARRLRPAASRQGNPEVSLGRVRAPEF